MRCHKITSAEVADGASWIQARHDGKSPNVVQQHLVHRLIEHFIRVSNDQVLATGTEDGGIAVAVLLERAQHIATGDDADQIFIIIDDQQAGVPRVFGIVRGNPVG